MLMATSSNDLIAELASVNALLPRVIRDTKGKATRIIAPATYTRQVVTVVGVKATTGRFLPVSHAGYSNETYVDKVDSLEKMRAEFTGRKLKGIERRAHMTLFRELTEWAGKRWQDFFTAKFGRECTIPDGLCIACWNCSLFGGLDAGKGATFSRIRYFDTFSVEDAAECVQTDDSPEQMAIGNTVGEDLSVQRGEASFHRYEYVKVGTHFPFITIIESPTLLDVAGYIHTIRRADAHGYGKYSANHGKFTTKLLAVATGYPRFSVLEMIEWAETGELEEKFTRGQFEAGSIKFDGLAWPKALSGGETPAQRDANEVEPKLGLPTALFGEEIEGLAAKLPGAFREYLDVLG